MSKPIIVCTRAEIKHDNVDRYAISRAYSDAIERAGGVALMLLGSPDENNVNAAMEIADGILLPGGGDIDPKSYHQDRQEYAGTPDPIRDQLEFVVIDKALERNIPLLGICRGLQAINVHLGGSLYQDTIQEMKGSIQHDWHNEPRETLKHEVAITPGTKLHSILGVDKIETNSLHHQGIHELGKGLVASAHTQDGLIEGIELPEKTFFMGVQWHPEHLEAEPWHKLFSAFITSTKK